MFNVMQEPCFSNHQSINNSRNDIIRITSLPSIRTNGLKWACIFGLGVHKLTSKRRIHFYSFGFYFRSELWNVHNNIGIGTKPVITFVDESAMASSPMPPSFSQISFNSNNAKWVLQGGHPTLSLTKSGIPFTVTQVTTVTPILPDTPLPQEFVQSAISSSSDAKSNVVSSQHNSVTLNLTSLNNVSSNMTPQTNVLSNMTPQTNVLSSVAPQPSVTSHVTSSEVTTKKLGSDPCIAPIASMSMKELRLKGSSFLRTHASKHGIPNASRWASTITITITIKVIWCDHFGAESNWL